VLSLVRPTFWMHRPPLVTLTPRHPLVLGTAAKILDTFDAVRLPKQLTGAMQEPSSVLANEL